MEFLSKSGLNDRLGKHGGDRLREALETVDDSQQDVLDAALHRVAIVRMREDEKTKAYADRRAKEGETRREILRFLKRYILCEIYRTLCASSAQSEGV